MRVKSVRSHRESRPAPPAAPDVWVASLASAVRTRRKQLKLTQGQLALLAGCGTAFLYALENGKRSLRMDKLVDVLQVLGLELRLQPGKGGFSLDEGLR